MKEKNNDYFEKQWIREEQWRYERQWIFWKIIEYMGIRQKDRLNNAKLPEYNALKWMCVENNERTIHHWSTVF